MIKKLLVVCGLTAIGKTSFASKLADQFDGELISADSRQVYQGMDIGTGKDVKKQKLKIPDEKLESLIEKRLGKEIQVGIYEINNVLIWGLDLVKPNQRFSVADFFVFVNSIISDIWQQGKLPILVGGTGFYIKAVVDGIDTLGIPPDWELRWRLKDKMPNQLLEKLARLDPQKAALLNVSDRQNPRRLIRAIEIARGTQESNQQRADKIKTDRLEIDKVLMIGLKAPLSVIYRRIDRRVNKRLKQGLVQEIESLLDKGFSFSNSVLGETLGYQEWEGHFEGKKTKDEVIKQWKNNEHGYARRQLTWFKKSERINWFDISDKDWQQKAGKMIENWLLE